MPSTRRRRPSAKIQLRLPALAIKQSPRRTLYSFACDGKQLLSFAAIARIHRDDDDGLQGYQRPEVVSHINEIRRYIESRDPMIPNGIVIAFDSRVRFVPDRRATGPDYVVTGTIIIPVDEDLDDAAKPGWIVDGQQRTAAIRDARIKRFPISISAFISSDGEDQRKQFILVNSTKPLPKGLIHELLPDTDGALPTRLMLKRLPARILMRLNRDVDSPLRRLIRTPTTADGLVKDNSVLRMLENSLTDGALYRYRDPDTGNGDLDPMLRILKSYWHAVREVFPPAWGLPPRKSRLMHGVGIVSMGLLMDAIFDRFSRDGVPTADDFAREIKAVRDICRWTEGVWNFGPGQQRKWNELQNTPRDIQLLTNHLLIEYKRRS